MNFAAIGCDEVEGCFEIIHHDVYQDAGFGDGFASDHPGAADFADTLCVKSECYPSPRQQLCIAESRQIKSSRTADIRGGNFQIANLAVTESGMRLPLHGAFTVKLWRPLRKQGIAKGGQMLLSVAVLDFISRLMGEEGKIDFLLVRGKRIPVGDDPEPAGAAVSFAHACGWLGAADHPTARFGG